MSTMRTVAEIDAEILETEQAIAHWTDANGDWRGTFHIWEMLTDDLAELRKELTTTSTRSSL